MMKSELEKILFIPVIIILVAFAIGTMTSGIDFIINHWKSALSIFAIAELFFLIIILTVNKRYNNLISNLQKNPKLVSLGFFINFFFLIYDRPEYFNRLLPATIIGPISWLIMPIILSEDFEKSYLYERLPKNIWIILYFFVYISLPCSLLFFIIYDIFNFLIPSFI